MGKTPRLQPRFKQRTLSNGAHLVWIESSTSSLALDHEICWRLCKDGIVDCTGTSQDRLVMRWRLRSPWTKEDVAEVFDAIGRASGRAA